MLFCVFISALILYSWIKFTEERKHSSKEGYYDSFNQSIQLIFIAQVCNLPFFFCGEKGEKNGNNYHFI